LPLAYDGRPIPDGWWRTLVNCLRENFVFFARVATIWSTV